MRADLTARRQRYQGQIYWVVKEPIGLKYFRFQEEEFAVLNMLKDGASLEDIKTKFEKDFAPHKITYQDLQQFIGTLHRSGLVISDAPGQGNQLRKRGDERTRKEFLAKLTNVLAIRFKGVDPERFLNWSFPYVRWFFSRTAAIVIVTMALVALLLVGVQFEQFRNQLPSFEGFFGGKKNWLLLGVTLAGTKVLHEFGHGYLCKKFGGECHEMGVMFLVLTPCLYCNVSDSWMLPNKWHRAAIGAGGIYVEICLATIATFIWWWTDDANLLNATALRVMFICSISTILFNGNPLLRFDGYYILSDVVEIPNLRQKASKILQRVLGEVCLGLEQPEDPFLPQRNHGFFMLYTIAAVMYRWFIFFSILFFLNKVFEPYGLKVIGQMIALMGMFGLFVQPLWKLGKFFHVPGRMDQVKWPRFYVTAAIAITIVLVILFIPLPRKVRCSLQMEPHAAESVYVQTPGRLTEVLARPGDTVKEGQELLRLASPALKLEMESLRSTLKTYKVQRDNLRKQLHLDRKAAGQIAVITELIDSKELELTAKEDVEARLVLRAPKDGTVLPAPFRPERPRMPRVLPSWSGSVFDAKNHGMFLEVGQSPLIQIGDPKKFDALLAIDQADNEFVEKGDPVEIKLDALAWRVFEGQVDEKSIKAIDQAPRAMGNQAGGNVPTRTDAAGRQIPLNATYEARSTIDDPDGVIGIGYRGRARVKAGWQTLGNRIWRYLARTFHFSL